MAEIYEFDPATDLQVLETFTFEEEIERPESLRFYTLDDQITDYFEKSVPVGKVSRHQLQQLQKDADRVRDLYQDIIVGTETSYEVRKERPHRGFLPWIVPVYSGVVQRRAFSWEEDYTPAFVPRQPRFYDRMIAALPRPYGFGEDGRRAVFPEPQRFVDDRGLNPIRAVPTFSRTRGILRAGGEYSIVPEPIPSTDDVVSVRGYWVAKRPLELIAPLDQHPILGSNDAHFFESQADYSDIVPSIEAILNHAVPVTPHPFREAGPYLKLYDIKWSEIPWSLWKRHFPAADPVSDGLPPDPVSLPTAQRDLPSESLQKQYTLQYRPGQSPRHWLELQVDGGALVPKLILTNASELPPISMPNPAPAPEVRLATATPSDCLPDGLTFDQLVTAGVYRPPGVCVPPEVIAKEKADLGFRGRQAWGETTQSDILTEYLPILKAAQGPPPAVLPEPVLPKLDLPAVSSTRTDVLAILKDETREPEDKLKDLRTLIQDLPLQEKLFLDADGQFVVCEHTLSLLEGDLGRDSRTFYTKWCAIVEGSRVCKFCGEAVNRDVFVNVDEFDDAGHALVHAEAPSVEEFHPGHVRSFTESLQTLRLLFDTRDPAQDILYLLISVLQILPERTWLEPILGQVRQLSAFTKSKGESAQAIYGVCGVALLMQIHDPFLIPRRSFGRSFLLTGFPREGDAEDPGILDSLLNALKRTFEQFRGSLKGSSTSLLREIFRDVKKVRDKCVVAMKVMARPPAQFIQKLSLNDYSSQLEEAAVRYAKAPPVPVQTSVLVQAKKIDTTEPAKRASALCLPETGLSFWSTDTPPVYMPPALQFGKQVVPGPTAHRVLPSSSARTLWSDLPSTTASRISKGAPAFLKQGSLSKTLADRTISWNQASSIAERLLTLARGVDVKDLWVELRSLDPTKNPSQVRDAARGIAYEVLQRVAKAPKVRETWAEVLPKDLALRAFLKTTEELEGEVRSLVTAERETFKTRLGEKSDMEREMIKQLLDIGLAPYVITLQDRQLFAEQLAEKLEPVDPLANPEVPEEGFQVVPNDAERDDGDQGERGNFGEMPNRPYEGNDEYGSADPDRGV